MEKNHIIIYISSIFFIAWGYRHILGVETVYYGIICLLIYLNKELYVDNVHVFISNFVCNISLQNILVNIMTLNFSPRFMQKHLCLNTMEFATITVLNLDLPSTPFNQSPTTKACSVWMHRYDLLSAYSTYSIMIVYYRNNL